MKIKLSKPWMGHPAGAEVVITNTIAKRLTGQGIIEKSELTKKMQGPGKDKMVKGATNK